MSRKALYGVETPSLLKIWALDFHQDMLIERMNAFYSHVLYIIHMYNEIINMAKKLIVSCNKWRDISPNW